MTAITSFYSSGLAVEHIVDDFTFEIRECVYVLPPTPKIGAF